MTRRSGAMIRHCVSLGLLLWLMMIAQFAVAQALPDLLTTEPAAEEPVAEEAAADAAGSDTAAETTDTTDVDPLRWIANPNAIDYGRWEDTAIRAEELLIRNQARSFALDRLRLEVAQWRDRFAQAMGENSERLVTVNSQIDALGPLPADGSSEATMIATRRDALIAQRDLLAAPGLLATEAHARASGLIREAETQLRDRQRDTFLSVSPSPLNPANWSIALAQLWTNTGEFFSEISDGVARAVQTADDKSRIARAVAALAVALFLFLRARRFWTETTRRERAGARHEFFEFLNTVAEAVIPLLGLVALSYGLTTLNIFGPRGAAIISTVPLTGGIIILAGWLARQFFPLGDRYGPLRIAVEVREPARRMALLLAWLTGLWIPFDAFVRFAESTDTASDVLNVPIIIVLSIILFRLASLVCHPPTPAAGADVGQGRTRRIIGRLTQLVALASPVLAATGYVTAAENLIFPTILTLAVCGIVVYLQSLTYRVHGLIFGATDRDNYALIPVAVGALLLLFSAPVLALIWGARRTDLLEYWVRFTEGFRFGETQISPSDFMWFILIFTFGYLATQFIKNTLRVTVLPRTSLDLGAQNAIVAGFGYVGVFLAAILAITGAGIDLSNLAIVAGALSVGIGFGLQNIVSNFVSGIILLIERPISEGDWIEVGDRMGFVRDISVRSTRIETFDQTDVIVPNADLVSNQVINWTRGNRIGRLIIPVGVAYGTNVEQVFAILREIAESHPIVVVNPPPAVLFMNFGADSLEFEIRAILRDITFINDVRSEMNAQIAQRFAAAGIEIPFAQRDIWLRNPEVLRPSDDKPVSPKGHWQDDDAADTTPHDLTGNAQSDDLPITGGDGDTN